jgi:hypothetical protein
VVPKWTIQREEFRGSDGRTFLRTDRGDYKVGGMSSVGFVRGIQGNVALVQPATGGLLYIVAEDARGPGVMGTSNDWRDPRDRVQAIVPGAAPTPDESAARAVLAGLPVPAKLTK